MGISRISNPLIKVAVFFLICGFVMGGFVLNTALALDGSGTQEDPWRIQSLDDFNDFAADANYWAGFTRLETDVNLAGRVYDRAVIAWDTDNTNAGFDGMPFEGVFYGGGRVIRNMIIDTTGANKDYLGLFGAISGDGAGVKNLGLVSVIVRAGNGSGGIGGLCGSNQSGHISKCYSSGVVTGDFVSRIGGLCGENQGIIDNCYSTSSVTGTRNVGGLCGNNGIGNIRNCYSNGPVTGTFAGGFCGFSGSSAYIIGCFWDVETSGIGEVGENDSGAIGKTTAEMKQQSTFTDWDFINVWNIGENQTYPYLRTYLPSDINKDRIINFLDFCIIADKWLQEQ